MRFLIRDKQTGAATLLMALVIISLISMISVYAAQVSVMEQKISINHLYSQQAFEAAEVGLEIVRHNLNKDIIQAVNKNKNQVGTLEDFNSAGIPIITHLKDSNNNQLGSFTFQFTNHESTDVINLRVDGFSANNSSGFPNQTIHQNLSFTPLIAQQPLSPVIAKGNVNLINNDIIITNLSKDSTTAIWSGKETYNIGKLITTHPNNIQSHHLELANLSNDDFLNNFFTKPRDRIKKQSNHIINCSKDCNADNLKDDFGNPLSGIIWIDAFRSTNNTYNTIFLEDVIQLGTSENPVIIIIDGYVEFKHTAASITGLVYTTQSVKNATEGTINGSLISEKNIKISGKMNIHYDQNAINNLIEKTGGFTRVAGSWRDF